MRFATHEQDGCPRQEEAHSRAKKKQKASSLSLGYAICANAQDNNLWSKYHFCNPHFDIDVAKTMTPKDDNFRS
jgi:hypothetical protein